MPVASDDVGKQIVNVLQRCGAAHKVVGAVGKAVEVIVLALRFHEEKHRQVR